MEELNQYKQAIEQSNIVSKTDIRGIITFVNDEFCKISGYEREELIGKNHNILRHPDVPKKDFKLLWDTILQKKTFKATAKNRSKDGSTFYVNTTISPILDKNGEILEFIAIRYDVTDTVLFTKKLEKKDEELEQLNLTLEKRVIEQTKQLLDLNKNLENRIEEEVKKNREKDKMMFQQARLAAMGEMIGNIAHQWRQPLSELGIILFNMKKLSLKNDFKQLEEQYEHGKSVVDRMSKTIDDFRNFFNPLKKKNEFYIKDVINEVLYILEGPFLKSDVQVETKICDNIIAYGYKNELSQAMLNIANNANDAFANSKQKQKLITIKAFVEENFICISVSDNAGGIKEDVMDKIFEPYFTTKHASSGTGLGLYIVKMIVENSMKGEVSAKNVHDGANFEIKIPIKLGV